MDPSTTPQSDADDGTNMSGISDDLQNFMQTWCDDEVEPADVAKMLHSSEGAQYQEWLPQELRAAYKGGVLTPAFLEMACNRHFDDQQGVTDWLQSVWQSWFDEPFDSTSDNAASAGPSQQ